MKSFLLKTDHELIHLFMDGDSNALEALIVRHKDKLYTSILFLVKDKYLAEDIFQDVIIKIIDTILAPYVGGFEISLRCKTDSWEKIFFASSSDVPTTCKQPTRSPYSPAFLAKDWQTRSGTLRSTK